jgi:hypothetical protein
MKFRYFIMRGKSLETFLASEQRELEQRRRMFQALLRDRDDILSYRPGHDGGVLSLTFKGDSPKCFVRASRKLSPDEVRPHGKSKEAKPWRELLESLRVTEDCQKTACKLLGLPVMACDGRKLFSSHVGHVGSEVYVEAPVSPEEPYEPHEDLVEVKAWEFEKAVEEAPESEEKGYVLESRAQG